MLVMIDNYDSFTYNLVQYFGELGQELRIFRNDAVTVEDVAALRPNYIVVSPGPGRPDAAGVSKAVIKELGATIPLLGVCLGHQAIGEVFGGQTVYAPSLFHGKTSLVEHDGKTVFKDIPSPCTATRYHSLVIDKDTLPSCLDVSAWMPSGEIMGVRHRTLPIEGIQFHPESILTTHGKTMLANFLKHYA